MADDGAARAARRAAARRLGIGARGQLRGQFRSGARELALLGTARGDAPAPRALRRALVGARVTGGGRVRGVERLGRRVADTRTCSPPAPCRAARWRRAPTA